MHAAFITPRDARWTEVLEGVPHDVYHLPGYVELAAAHEGGQPCAFFAETDQRDTFFLMPLLLRPVPYTLEDGETWHDASSPYGYPAPIHTPDQPPEFLQEVFRQFQVRCVEARIVTAFVRSHPLLPCDLPVFEQFGQIVNHGQTVYVDLSLDDETWWMEISTNHRRNIHKAQKSGYDTAIDDWTHLEAFKRIYISTMEQMDASTFYFFDDAYFKGLRQALGDRIHLMTVLAPDGAVAAGGLFTAMNGIVQYHLGATDSHYLRDSPAKLMFYEAIRWAKARGASVLHLGGGLGGRADSLFEFKAGFSKQTAPFHTCRFVLDEEVYGQLANHWQMEAGAAEAETDFFPLYRANAHS